MDPLSYFILPILLKIENYIAWFERIKYAIASFDADYLIIAIAMSVKNKKL